MSFIGGESDEARTGGNDGLRRAWCSWAGSGLPGPGGGAGSRRQCRLIAFGGALLIGWGRSRSARQLRPALVLQQGGAHSPSARRAAPRRPSSGRHPLLSVVAIAAVVRFVFARGIVGMKDASATYSPSVPKTRPCASTTVPSGQVPAGGSSCGSCRARTAPDRPLPARARRRAAPERLGRPDRAASSTPSTSGTRSSSRVRNPRSTIGGSTGRPTGVALVPSTAASCGRRRCSPDTPCPRA